MIFEAILFFLRNTDYQLLNQKIGEKTFIHYQLGFLEENLLRKTVIVVNEHTAFLEPILGNRLGQMELVFVRVSGELSQIEQISQAFYYISDTYALVLNGASFFRLNISKADDFRRMRETRLLAVGKIAGESDHEKDLIHLDGRGQILEMGGHTIDSETVFYTDTWVISKAYFQKNFSDKQGSLFQYLKDNYERSPLFAMICRQYFIHLAGQDDFARAQHEIIENYF